MPKIIENLKPRLIEEARRQVKEFGYNAMAVRSIAKSCGVSVGTVYNYFPSKDDLLAACMLEDWNRCIESINDAASGSDDPETLVRCIYDQLLAYGRSYEAVFHDPHAVSGYAGASGRYHGMLRAQLASPLRKYCGSDFSADFISEALLTWTMEGIEIEKLYSEIKKLL